MNVDPQSPPRRRWYQFSLRTVSRTILRTILIVAAVPALFVIWEVNIVRQRRAMLEELTANGCYWSIAKPRDLVDRPWTLIPMTRKLLGDTPVGAIFVGRSPMENRYREIQGMFPEAMMPIE